PLSGVLVDRVSRKKLLWLSDSGAACCTVSVGLLAGFHRLEIWHLYLIASILGGLGNIQGLTYTTLIPLIVPKQHHTRASSMGAIVDYGAAIFAPALAGLLYPTVGLLGITVVDMITFIVAMAALAWVDFPTLNPTAKTRSRLEKSPEDTQGFRRPVWHDLTFGFRYIASHPNLLAMAVAMSTFTFLHQIAETLYQPMVLARTGGNTQVLGVVVAASGIGGVLGAIIFSVWEGFRDRPLGMLLGFIGTGCSQLLLGMGALPGLWMASRFAMAFHHPLLMSSYMAVWYSSVNPTLQGRVFSADYMLGTVVMLSASLAAGPLADRVFEPWMQEQVTPFTAILGAGPGSGMALLQVFLALGILLISAIGLGILRHWRASNG
ncbi:MAG: MFS transporter, partial [Cyanobacteria bacterium P01_H01_bin.130]